MKSGKLRLILLTVFLILSGTAVSQTIIVEGHAFLESQACHDSIKVKFERLAPSYLIDSTYTDVSGCFSVDLESGIYKPTFSKIGYVDIHYVETPLYQNSTLNDQTLEKSGLYGELTGHLASGVYKVDANIYIPENESLSIEPGTTLKFKQDVVFDVYGLLNAIGTVEDSIIFTRFADSINWKGIDFKENSSDLSILKYCVVEYSNERGISAFHCSPTIANSTIQKNFHETNNSGSQEQEGGGAGICLQYSDSRIDKVIVRDNTGLTAGIGLYFRYSNAYVSNSIISNNINPIAYTDYRPGGGAFCEFENTLTIENSVICYNTNSIGGGICIGDRQNTTSTDVKISNCIICGNHVDGDYPSGGGILTFGEPILSVYNTLFWNNTLEDVNCDDPWLCVNVTINNNLDSCDAYGNLTLDPHFVSPNTEDFSLESSSPCIDAGSNFFVTSETDFLHNCRIWDGNYNNESIVDMGAYEFDAEYCPVSLIENNSIFNKEVTIFPNPSKNYISIDIQDIMQIEVYDNAGCFKFKSSQSKIDISNLKTGLYFLKITDKKHNFYSGKVMKY